MSPHPDERGKQLRLDVRDLYSTLKSTGALQTRPPYINDITEFVTKYLPREIPFDEAERILRSAGFNVSERPPAYLPGDRIDRYDVIATMPLKFNRAFFGLLVFGKTEIMLGMRPKSPGDYTTVKEMWAYIKQVYL
jgi:hypothetical protein